jgi:acyl-CoA hydrolase/ferredoxin
MEEMESLHQHFRERTFDSDCDNPCVKDFTFRSSTVIFPENRNAHGKLFGGYVMEEAQALAQYSATFLSKGGPIFPLGIDEAVFLQPIAVGDCVTFTARVVHCTTHTCRVLVHVEVRDPAHRDMVPARTNRLMFVFGGSNFPDSILPITYSEILMSIDAQRRHAITGPSQEFVEQIVKESSRMKPPKTKFAGLLSQNKPRTQQVRFFSSSTQESLPPEEQAVQFLIRIGHDDPKIAKGVVNALKESGLSGSALLNMIKAMAGRWEVGEDAGLEDLVEAVRVNLLKDEGRTQINLLVVPASAWKSSEEDAEDYADIDETPEEHAEALKRAFNVKAMTGLTLTDVAKFGEGEGASYLGESIECACAGIMACSTCHVVIDPEYYDKGIVEKPSESELDMLDLAYAPRRTSRLACQIVLDESMDGMVIRLPKGSNNLMDFVPFSE